MAPLSSVLIIDDDKAAGFIAELVVRKAQVAPAVLRIPSLQEALDRPLPPSAAPTTLVLLSSSCVDEFGLLVLDAQRERHHLLQDAVVVFVATDYQTSIPKLDLIQQRGVRPVCSLIKPLTVEKVSQLVESLPLAHSPQQFSQHGS